MGRSVIDKGTGCVDYVPLQNVHECMRLEFILLISILTSASNGDLLYHYDM